MPNKGKIIISFHCTSRRSQNKKPTRAKQKSLDSKKRFVFVSDATEITSVKYSSLNEDYFTGRIKRGSSKELLTFRLQTVDPAVRIDRRFHRTVDQTVRTD